jgi:hypothetical protein
MFLGLALTANRTRPLPSWEQAATLTPPATGLLLWTNVSSLSGLSHGDEVPEWNDSSGNGNTIEAGAVAIPVWDSAAQRVIIYADTGGAGGGNGYFILPLTITATTADFSLFVIGEKINLRRAGAIGSLREVGYLLAATEVGAANIIHRAGNVLLAAGNVSEEGTTKLISSTSLIGYTSHGSGDMRLIVNDTEEAITDTVFNDGGTPVTYAGAYLFGLPEVADIAPWQMAVKHVLIYDHALSAEDLNLLQAFAEQEGVNYSPTKNLVIDSDSIGNGNNALPFRGWARRLSLGDEWRIANVSEPGITVATMISDGPAVVDSRLDPFALVNALLLGGGVNDLNGDPGLTVYANIVEYCEDRTVAGWAVGIIGLPDSFVDNTERQALRSALLADFSVPSGIPNIWLAGPGVEYAIAYADVGADADIGLDGTHLDTDLFADGLHQTEAGHVKYVPYADALIEVLVPDLMFDPAGDAMFTPGGSLMFT